MTTQEQLTAIWNSPGVQFASRLTKWTHSADGKLVPLEGALRKPTWDKAVLKRAKQELPNWYYRRDEHYY